MTDNVHELNPRQVTARDSRDAKLADAYRDLEAPIFATLSVPAKIAERFAYEDDRGLGQFAVEQFLKLASDLVRLYDEKHAAAR
jgi:hypothetical protein